MGSDRTLHERCHIISGDECDKFVGIKADSDDACISFPIGYRLPKSEDDLRSDIQNLIGLLTIYDEEKLIDKQEDKLEKEDTYFPIHAYFKILNQFLRTGRYYVEREPKYHTGSRGKISWQRTVKDQRGLIQEDSSVVYANFTVRSVTPNVNRQITQIHKYCVYEAFDKLGWLYVSFKPEKPETYLSEKESIAILNSKLSTTYNDNDRELFRAMKDMLEYKDLKDSDKDNYFGSIYFERIWERMVDIAFGIKDKQPYYPKTNWNLSTGHKKTPRDLHPDSIMFFRDKYYILDSKFYKYGVTGNLDHLPTGPDICKQITYGEYISRHPERIPNERLFNAFVMPFNMEDNPLNINEPIGNVGEAIGYWRENLLNYERIQGIVIDTRFLMLNYRRMTDEYKSKLVNCIESGLEKENKAT